MARQIVSKEQAVEMKRSRVPLHEARDKIKTQGLDYDNFHYIFINIEDADNVARYLSAGYAGVEQSGKHIVGDQVVDSSIGTSSLITIGGGKGAVLGLFCLPIDLYLEDQAAEEKERADVEKGLIKDINRMSNPRAGGLGTGVTAFGSGVTSTLGHVADED